MSAVETGAGAIVKIGGGVRAVHEQERWVCGGRGKRFTSESSCARVKARHRKKVRDVGVWGVQLPMREAARCGVSQEF